MALVRKVSGKRRLWLRVIQLLPLWPVEMKFVNPVMDGPNRQYRWALRLAAVCGQRGTNWSLNETLER